MAITRNPQAISLLLAHLHDPQLEVKHMVIYALGRIRGTVAEVTEVIATLIEFLTDTDFETRLVAVQALGKIASQFATSTTDTQRIIACLLKCLETEEDWCVKEAIALAFSMIKISDASHKNAVIKALKKLLTDESIFVKKAAAYTYNILQKSLQKDEEVEDDSVYASSDSVVPVWIANGIAPSKLGWRVGNKKELAPAKGEDDEALSKFVYKDLSIAGQSYRLQVIPLDKPNTYIFRLINNTPFCKVPGGFKLMLLTSDGEEFEGNTNVDAMATDALEITVSLTPEKGLIWKTEPQPENYVEETLWF